METAGERRCFKNAGQIYYGDVIETENGSCLRHGQGLQILTAKTVDGLPVMWGRYKGSWKKGHMDGHGVYRWSDGSSYEGSFSAGKLHGTGTLTWPEGSVYDGMWANGEMSGQGCFMNAFDGITMQGIFYRNNFRLHDGSWVDVRHKREQQRRDRLKIGAAPSSAAAAQMPVHYCEPEALADKVAAVLREPPHLVPLVVADPSCPAGAGAPAPLWCLEEGKRGCNHETTVHMNYAAAEQRRRRDCQKIFQGAVCEALLSGRPLTLVFGNTGGPPPEGEEELPVPQEWSLEHFFSRLSLPPDIFDLQHFHGSGDADLFLPPERRGWLCSAGKEKQRKRKGGEKRAEDGSASSASSSSSSDDEGGKPAAAAADGAAAAADGGGAPDGGEVQASPPTLLPATVHLLNVALVSLTPLHGETDPESVRQYMAHRFARHVPVHRIAVIVVSGPR